ncbi:MAG: U32 family peptidase [Hyphomicrobiales bacterium]|nr:U32 family peptidase [Hyphomicrobiales bacterium]
MKLTIGPVLYNWESDRFADFYARIADEAPVDRVYVGEVVCSKREPMRGDAVAIAAERLERGGKEVVLSTLALVTLKRERRQIADLASGGAAGLIEANDVTALAHLGGRPHIIGPFLNVYNEGTLARLAEAGAATVCLPPELPISSIAPIAAEASARQVETEIFAFGRVPLAVSARCYHARVHGLAKDSCQYVCDQDADGLDVDTLDGQKFLAVNGIQTLSQSWSNLIGDIPELIGAGVGAFRLSPQTCDMVAVAKAFRDVLDKRCDPDAGAAALADLLPDVIFSNGFLRGEAGAKFAAVG